MLPKNPTKKNQQAYPEPVPTVKIKNPKKLLEETSKSTAAMMKRLKAKGER